MNARVKVVSGHFQVVVEVKDAQLEELAKLLSLNEEDKKALKENGGLVVVGPLVDPNPTS